MRFFIILLKIHLYQLVLFIFILSSNFMNLSYFLLYLLLFLLINHFLLCYFLLQLIYLLLIILPPTLFLFSLSLFILSFLVNPRFSPINQLYFKNFNLLFYSISFLTLILLPLRKTPFII